MFKKIFCYTVLLTNSFALATGMDDIKWTMQDYPPFSYVDESSKNAGLATEVVGELFKRLKAKKTVDNIDVVKFARGIAQITAEKDTAFFTVVRLPEREKLFKWVGAVGKNRPVLFVKKAAQIKIGSVNDLNNYQISAKRGASIESLLKKTGVEEKKLSLAGTDDEVLKMLKAGRVEIAAINDLVGYYLMKKNQMNRDEYEIVYRLREDDLAIAFNQSVSDDLIAKLQKELEDMKTSKNGELSEFDKILKKYN